MTKIKVLTESRMVPSVSRVEAPLSPIYSPQTGKGADELAERLSEIRCELVVRSHRRARCVGRDGRTLNRFRREWIERRERARGRGGRHSCADAQRIGDTAAIEHVQ